MLTSDDFAAGWTIRNLDTGNEHDVDLPHDAMIGEPRSASAAAGSHGGYFPGGHYRYTKEFFAHPTEDEQLQWLLFEGVQGQASIQLNGREIGTSISPYREFEVQLDELRAGPNVLEVEVDTSAAPSSRWYAGSGLYRPVRLLSAGSARFTADGIRTETIRGPSGAVLVVTTEVKSSPSGSVEVRAELREGSQVISIAAGPVGRLELAVQEPHLWDALDPHLYDLTVELHVNGLLSHRVEQRVGLRTVEVDPAHGLRVNGTTVLLRGACVHHDNGPLGAATFRDAEFRRARILKETGFNAVRSSHNPLSRAFLDACDSVGIYVLDESTDVWFEPKTQYDLAPRFEEVWRDDLSSMVAKDRNHPSVIMYSIGNEISETSRPDGVLAARRLHAFTHELDPTRPTTLAINFLLNFLSARGRQVRNADESSDGSSGRVTSTIANQVTQRVGKIMGLIARLPQADRATRDAFAQVDVAGYNYSWSRYRGDGHRYPSRVILGTESMPGEIAQIWPIVERLPHVIGDFLWTGWDYLGEAGIGTWSYGKASGALAKPFPHVIAGPGVVDITGEVGAAALLAQAVWGLLTAPQIAVRPLDHAGQRANRTAWRSTDAVRSWSWLGRDGTRAQIEVYSADDEVELQLNGRSLGRRSAGPRHGFLARFEVEYRRGSLVAIGYRAGRETGRSELQSAGATSIQLIVEQQPDPDEQRLAFVQIVIADSAGVVEMLDDDEVTVSIDGPAVLAGYGSADPQQTVGFQRPTRRTFYGRALVILRRTNGSAPITLTATSVRHGSVTLVVPVGTGRRGAHRLNSRRQ